MNRLLETSRLILASHNAGKLREMRELMADCLSRKKPVRPLLKMLN